MVTTSSGATRTTTTLSGGTSTTTTSFGETCLTMVTWVAKTKTTISSGVIASSNCRRRAQMEGHADGHPSARRVDNHARSAHELYESNDPVRRRHQFELA